MVNYRIVNMRDQTSFGTWLKQRRKTQDLTQAELARRIGCATDTIKKIESGVLRPSRQLAELMGEFFAVAAEEREAFVQFARSGGRTPGQLSPAHASALFSVPLPLTPLVGREREVQAGSKLLLQTGTRLLTLYGPPGVGKTRLSMEIGLDVQDAFEHGACFVSLSPIQEPGLVLSGIANALRLREERAEPLLTTVRTFLHDKRLLLVLDNFEQVIDAAPVVKELLIDAPGVKVLVTSRELLHLYGEQGFPVPPLSTPDVFHLPPLEAVALYPAVGLFVQRARAIKPDFQLTQANVEQVALLCAWLDGLPLAIEMAAAQVKWLPLTQLLAHLKTRLAALTGGLRDLSPRQQTLRGAIDWSYDLLSPRERALFRRLSVFSGGCTETAVQTVIGHWDAHSSDGLASDLELLADKSLLTHAVTPEGETRFSMLETIREYAREKLRENSEEPEAQRRHAAYYLALAHTAEPELNGPRQVLWFGRLEADLSNFRAALDWCAASNTQTGLMLATSLWQFWLIHGSAGEGRARLEELLSHAGAAPVELRAWAIRAAAALAHQQGYPERAEKLIRECQALFRQIGNRAGIAASLHLLGNVALMQSDYAVALDNYVEALALYRQEGNLLSQASVLMNMGLIAKDQGDYQRSMTLYEESRALHEQLGNRRGIATALTHLSIAAYWMGNYALAASVTEQALALHREAGNRMDEAYALDTLGMAKYKQGDLAGAILLMQECLAIMQEVGDKSGMAMALTELGSVVYATGDLARAAELHGRALQTSVQVGDKRRIAFCLEGLAAAIAQQQPVRAATLYGAADHLREVIGTPLPPSEQAGYEACVSRVRLQLGAAGFDAAYAAGNAMTMDQAVAFAGYTA